jgi:ubiquinone/menaquinone biosynthesis C-methylase UbiE
MSIFELQRVAEPEVMDDSAEVEAYSSAAAQSYLNAIDDTFVEHAVRLARGRERGRALDIGTGPGQIVLKLARQLTRWKFVGVDRSPNMIAQGLASLSTAAELAGRVQFYVADGNQLPFRDWTFDLVVCNSVLHHLAEPQKLLTEIARLAKPGGAILLRDLRRPSRFAYPFHVRRHGRHYHGLMYKLYCDSVRSAYTFEELQNLLDSSPMQRAKIFEHAKTHIGIERPVSL